MRKSNWKHLFSLAVLIASMTGACGNKAEETKAVSETAAEAETTASAAETKTEEINKEKNTATSSGETMFQKALKQVDEDLAPLPEKDSGKKLAAIESTLTNSFWVTMQHGYEDAAKEYGVSIDIQATDSDTDTAGQLDILNNMLVKDYEAISVSPLTGDNLVSGIVQANEDGIKIVTTGNEVNEETLQQAGGKVDAKITVDFYKQGEMGAQYIIDKNGDGKKVAIIAGNEGGTQANARRDGAKDTFEKAGYNVVAIEQCDFDPQKAYDAASAVMEANPDVVGFACGNDDMALGVVRALEEKDLKNHVTVVGVDFTEEAKAAISDGSYDASVAMSPYLMGKQGVIIMLKALEGQDVSEVGDNTPMVLVNASNVEDMDDWK